MSPVLNELRRPAVGLHGNGGLLNSRSDFKLLRRVISKFEPLYTLVHVMAEVSNLTDLTGAERIRAREVLKELLTIMQEPVMASRQAAQNRFYGRHGLVDAAIASLASDNKCAVLTDDLDLYLALNRDGIEVLNFTHLQARDWGV